MNILSGNRMTQSRGGFTLLELIITVAIISILSVLLFSAIRAVRESAWHVQCQSNTGRIIQGCMMFSQENRNKLVPIGVEEVSINSGYVASLPAIGAERIVNIQKSTSWPDLINVYIGNDYVFSCPKLKNTIGSKMPMDCDGGGCGSTRYVLGIAGAWSSWVQLATRNFIGAIWQDSKGARSFLSIASPSDSICFVDAGDDNVSLADANGFVPWNQRYDVPGKTRLHWDSSKTDVTLSCSQGVKIRHRGRLTAGFADGHVVSADPNSIKWNTKAVGDTKSYIGYTGY